MGRAAFAGAISYTTKEPGPEFESQVRVEAGNYGLRQLDGSLGGPVVGLEDLLGIRWTGALWSRDGFYTNEPTGQDMGDESGWGSSVTFVLTPGDDIKIKLRTEYSDSKFGQRPNVRFGGGSLGRSGAEGADGLVFYPYPLDPDLVQGTSNTATRLSDFGPDWPSMNALNLSGPTGIYCPETFPLPDFSQLSAAELEKFQFGGYCAPAGYGTAKGVQPAVDTDPVTGRDYQGTETQLWRTTLNASIDYDYGTFTLITGWTQYDSYDELDQDYQDSPVGSAWKSQQQTRLDGNTEQFSNEIRFASNFDGPVNFTLGGLYWQEKRAQDDFNFIVSCIEYGKVGPGNVFPDPGAFISGICDGANNTISSWQERALDVFPCQYENGVPVPDPSGQGNCLQAPRTPAPWRSTTEHWSAYFNVIWDLSDTFQLTLENRYVDESFELLRPNFSSCTNLFFAFGDGTSIRANGDLEGPVTTGADDIVCVSEARMNPNIPENVNAQNGDWMLVEGTERSSFNTPKVTLNWKPTDNSMYYFSWGKGIKPGGINTLAAGGSPTTIDDERFLPEKVEAWEVGAKTDWELGGFLRLNGALFFNDYTDKQIGTQIVNAQGVSQPRIINASGAEIWGVELEATWQPAALEGLILSLNYTYLDATFSDFRDRTRSAVRAAYAGNCTLVGVDTNDNDVPPLTVPATQRFCELNLTGNKLERTPENALVGNVQYTAPFMSTDFDWFVEGTATFEDERFLDADNAVFWNEYWRVDTRLGFAGESFELLVYVNNLFNNLTIQTGGSGPDFGQQVTELGFTAGLGTSHFFGLLPNPRTFGARVTMRF